MRKITVYECERTKTLFRTRKAYDKHLAKMVKNAVMERDKRRQIRARNRAIAPLYEFTSFRQIEQWLLENWKYLHHAFGNSSDRLLNVTDIQLFNMTFGSQSCSHSAPLGKKTNWGGKKTDENGVLLPLAYVGWKGSIAIYYNSRGSGDYHFLHDIGICTGGGGGGNNRYEFEVTLWSDDFPLLSHIKTVGLAHDIVHHMGRIDLTTRAKNWVEFRRKLRVLSSHAVTPYSDLSDEVDQIALAFSGSPYRYLVHDVSFEYKLGAKFQSDYERYKDLPFLPLSNRLDRMQSFLMVEPDLAIQWKLSGQLKPKAQIIDLEARFRLLKEEGKI